MIRIRTASNQYFDIYPGTTIQIVRENPFFSLEFNFSSAYTMPFNLPKTKKNVQLIGDLDNTQVSDILKIVPARLSIDGDDEIVGQINVLDIDKDNFSVSITKDSVKFNLDKKLNEYAFFDDGAAQTATQRNATLPISYPDIAYKFLQTANFGDNYSTGFAPNNFDIKSLTNYTHGAFYGVFDDTETIVPYFYVLYVLEQLAAKNDYKLTGSFRLDQEIKRVLIFNRNTLNYNPNLNLYGAKGALNRTHFILTPSGTIVNSGSRLAPNNLTVNSHFKINVGALIEFYVNIVETNGTISSSYLISHTFTAPELADGPKGVIDALVTDIIAADPAIQQVGTYDDPYLLKRELEYSGTDKQIIISRSATENSFGTYYATRGIWNQFHQIPLAPISGTMSYNSIKSDMHLPAIAANDYLASIHLNFCTIIEIDTTKGTMDIAFKKDALTGYVLDITPYLAQDRKQKFTEELNLRLTWQADDEDTKMDYELKHANNYPEHIAEPLTEISIIGGTLRKDAFDSNFPIATQMCIYDMVYGDYENPKDCKLRYIREEYLDPSATYLGRNASNTNLYPTDIYNLYWKDYYHFIKSGLRIWTVTANLPLPVLQKIKATTRLREKNQNYIWKTITTNVHSELGVTESTIDWVKQ